MKQAHKDEEKITATDSYKNRTSIEPDSSLLILQAVIDDQRLFTCMVVSMSNLKEYPVEVEVHSEYRFLYKIILITEIINLPLVEQNQYSRRLPQKFHYRIYTVHSQLVENASEVQSRCH